MGTLSLEMSSAFK